MRCWARGIRHVDAGEIDCAMLSFISHLPPPNSFAALSPASEEVLFSSFPIKLHRLVNWGGGANSTSDVTGMQVIKAPVGLSPLAFECRRALWYTRSIVFLLFLPTSLPR